MASRVAIAMAELFWQTKHLTEMTHDEWESICDGCAKCCVTKLLDVKTEQLVFTDVACELLNANTCRCLDYTNRNKRVIDCVTLTPQNVDEYAKFMPSTCSYRLLLEGKPLPAWHHLVSGDDDTIHKAGKSVQGRVRMKADVDENDLENYVVDWC